MRWEGRREGEKKKGEGERDCKSLVKKVNSSSIHNYKTHEGIKLTLRKTKNRF